MLHGIEHLLFLIMVDSVFTWMPVCSRCWWDQHPHGYNNNNNNNPLFILGYTIRIASLHHGPVPYTKIKSIYIQDKTNC